jgi:L-lactate dehydrogenase complex protein LldG
MSEARTAILLGIRRSLRRTGPLSRPVSAALDARLREPVGHARPDLRGDLVGQFREKLCAAGGSVEWVGSEAEVVDAVTRYLRDHQLPPRLILSGEGWMPRLDWPASVAISTARPARDGDRVSVTGALAGVAETGSLLGISSPRSPTTLNFLPDDHIVVLGCRDLVASLEDAWDRLRTECPEMPRTVNLISGPSKTADVEQTLELGAHGPRRLHAILVGARS